MTQEDFYENVKNAGPFEVTAHGIRKIATERCPITEVAFRLCGHEYDNEDWDMAARAMELDKEFAHTIVCVADDLTPWSDDGRKLLDACGIKEPE